MVAKRALQLGLESHNYQRELISRLVSDLYGTVLSHEDITRAFHELLVSIDELMLDTPDAPTVSIS
jgi:hypothetical protein